MGSSNEYNLASSGGGGKLKLKGAKITDGRVEKKKGKKKKKQQQQEPREQSEDGETSKDRDVSKEEKKGVDDEGAVDLDDEGKEEGVVVGKTEAERRYEEIRRKRLDERLKREGVKTHKERVEELNKYLSNLSEHHDMPRIGPG